jgi:ABC-2 type transport system permease protein
VFVLGGLVLPLTLYPDWLRRIAEASPFSAFLYGPGRLALGFDPAAALRTVAMLLLWGAAAGLLAAWLHRRGLRVLDVNGG